MPLKKESNDLQHTSLGACVTSSSSLDPPNYKMTFFQILSGERHE